MPTDQPAIEPGPPDRDDLVTGQLEEADVPSFPVKLYVNLRPPELMQVTFVMMYGGSEEIVARGRTRAAIDQFIEAQGFRKHERLRRIVITNADGTTETIAPSA